MHNVKCSPICACMAIIRNSLYQCWYFYSWGWKLKFMHFLDFFLTESWTTFIIYHVYSYILHNLFNLDITHFFTLNHSSRTWGHTFKLLKEQIFKDVRADSFSQRVINSWNRLPTEVVTAPRLGVFKSLFLYLRIRIFTGLVPYLFPV